MVLKKKKKRKNKPGQGRPALAKDQRKKAVTVRMKPRLMRILKLSHGTVQKWVNEMSCVLIGEK